MGKRLLFGIEVGGFLALLAVPAAAAMLFWMKAFTPSSVLVATTPASFSAVVIAVTFLFLPDLAGDFRFRVPMNIAFPAIFAVVNLVVARGIWFAPSAVRSPHEVLNPIQVWFDPRMIVLTLLIQVIGLTIACRPWQTYPEETTEPSQAESDPEADGS